MKENGSDLEEIIREELHKEAEETRRTVEASETEELSRDRKEAIRQNLKEQIDEYKKLGKKIPVQWIKNPFYVKYYRAKGMLDEGAAPGGDK